MARLLVVSRSMALALRLADTHDVVEASVDHLATLHPSPDVDAVVLDVGEPALAVQTIDRLRRDGDTTPLLVVSGYQAAWAGLTAIDVPGVVVVPLPVTRAALLEGIDRLLAAARSTGLGEPELDPATGGWRSGGFDWWDDAAGPARPAGPEALPVTAAGSAAAPSPAAPGAGGEPTIGAAPAPAPDGPGTSAVAAAPRTPSAEARAAEPRATRHRPEPRVL
ncbi:MAG TPA: hypothetical protein VI248_09570, partial [Kineosporiaceae bacterium]